MTEGPPDYEAAWHDLVTRLEQPAPADLEPAPWPALENIRHRPTDAARRGGDDQSRVIRPAGLGPGLPWLFPSSAGPPGGAGASGPDASGEAPPTGAAVPAEPDDDQDERYVPPPVPPVPSLKPLTRGAWLALFGGPGYLFAGTLLGWQVPGWAALAAIAAFVTGFAILVIRLGDGPSRRDDPDQGAIV